MKKTSKIHLVLVTAILASCNRVIIPDQPEAGYTPDPSLTAAPLDNDDSSACVCGVDTTYYNYPLDYFNFYFNGPPYAFRYAPASIYRKGAHWPSHAFVVRGGFGKAAASTAS
ncbi:MAG TPA: hypothetical protein VGS79_01145 [Puia sp.]|nr:hypothetical protein [Puia sp.]